MFFPYLSQPFTQKLFHIVGQGTDKSAAHWLWPVQEPAAPWLPGLKPHHPTHHWDVQIAGIVQIQAVLGTSKKRREFCKRNTIKITCREIICCRQWYESWLLDFLSGLQGNYRSNRRLWRFHPEVCLSRHLNHLPTHSRGKLSLALQWIYHYCCSDETTLSTIFRGIANNHADNFRLISCRENLWLLFWSPLSARFNISTGDSLRVAWSVERECREQLDSPKQLEIWRTGGLRPRLQPRRVHQDKENHREDWPWICCWYHGIVHLKWLALGIWKLKQRTQSLKIDG